VQCKHHYHLMECNLFSSCVYSWKIAHLALNCNHSLTYFNQFFFNRSEILLKLRIVLHSLVYKLPKMWLSPGPLSPKEKFPDQYSADFYIYKVCTVKTKSCDFIIINCSYLLLSLSFNVCFIQIYFSKISQNRSPKYISLILNTNGWFS
jgi:hypothetical protein